MSMTNEEYVAKHQHLLKTEYKLASGIAGVGLGWWMSIVFASMFIYIQVGPKELALTYGALFSVLTSISGIGFVAAHTLITRFLLQKFVIKVILEQVKDLQVTQKEKASAIGIALIAMMTYFFILQITAALLGQAGLLTDIVV